MTNKKSIIAGLTVLAIVFSFVLVFFASNVADAKKGGRDNDDVDDIDEVDVNNLPAALGKFQLKGFLTAVNVSAVPAPTGTSTATSTPPVATVFSVAVNGLTVNVAADAKIRGSGFGRGDLANLMVGDRVEVSGRIENGVLTADKIRVKGVRRFQGGLQFPITLPGVIPGADVVNKINEINQKIADILAKIADLQNRIRQQQPTSTATST